MVGFNHLSYWEKDSFVGHPDYVVIGSGIVGLSTAIFLKEREPTKKVTVLERGFLPTGASTKNAGFACIGSPGEILDDLKSMDESVVFATTLRRWLGLKELEKLLGKDKIAYTHLLSYELFSDANSNTFDACCDRLSDLNEKICEITGVSEALVVDEKICKSGGFSGFSRAISSRVEGQIDTGKMMKSLLQKAVECGVVLLNGIEVYNVDGKTLNTSQGSLSFEKLLVCTNGFSKRFFPELDVEPARAQVLVTSEIPDLKFRGNFHYDRGYYYFRNVGKRVLFGGGRITDLKGENTTDMSITSGIMNHLEQMLETMILPGQTFEIEHRWAGTMGVGAAKAPIIQQMGEDIFCAIRLGGMGVAMGTLVGKELAELATKS